MSTQDCISETTDFYEKFAKAFRKEAISHLTEETTEEILAEEKLRFQAAGQTDITPNQITGNNTLRYCKDLLRSRQPLFPIYQLLCLASELSVGMLIVSLLISSCSYFLANGHAGGHGFFAAFPFLYPAILMFGIILYLHLKRAGQNRLLLRAAKASDMTDIQKKLQRYQLRTLAICLLTISVLCGLTYLFKLSNLYLANITQFFFFYVICMVLSGIHNTIYSSHAPAFLAVGLAIFGRKPAELLEEATHAYMKQSYVQLMGQAYSTDALSDEELTRRLRTRLTTHRMFYILALVLVLALDILGFINLLSLADKITILIFTLICLAVTVLLLVLLLAAQHIIRQLPKN